MGIPACLARKVFCVLSADVLPVQMLSVSKEQEKQVKKSSQMQGYPEISFKEVHRYRSLNMFNRPSSLKRTS